MLVSVCTLIGKADVGLVLQITGEVNNVHDDKYSLIGMTDEDGEYIWEMCGEYWCETCIDEDKAHADAVTNYKQWLAEGDG